MEDENLLKETVQVLKDNGKKLEDVAFIVGNGFEISMADFIRIADGFDYNAGYGHQYVPDDLKIVGADWWMERFEYDGSESWCFKKLPVRPDRVRKLVGIDGREYDVEKYMYEKGEGDAEDE